MNVWSYVLMFILGATALILAISVMAVVSITWFARRRSEKILKKYLSKLEKMMPGLNCGECGCETCKAYAMDIFSCRKDSDCCTKGGKTLTNQINTCLEEFQNILEPQEKTKNTP